MPLRFGPLALSSAALLAVALLAPSDARACGGCFHQENQPETTVVTGHRMAFSVSTNQTVLWDQIQYTGDPKDFAWVLPIKPGARIEVASDAWFETLEAATTTHVVAPHLNCVVNSNDAVASSGCGCSNLFGPSAAGNGIDISPPTPDEGPPPPVTVTHEASVGPYETVTVHANARGALTGWLKDHGYAVDASLQPIIDAYTRDNFDFIAMRLNPKAGVKQMKSVRVVSPGAPPTLPLRMVAAGTGPSVAITLFVIGHGRWEPANFPSATIDAQDLSWDFNANASDYAKIHQKALEAEDGRTWLSVYSKHGSLLSPVMNPTTFTPVQYGPSSTFVLPTTIGDSYRLQGFEIGETSSATCGQVIKHYAMDTGIVADLCSHPEKGDGEPSATCRDPLPSQIDARIFACGDLDDLGVALTGLHPRDVWLTRLEANLPREALADDLILQAVSEQEQAEVENWKEAGKVVNATCKPLEVDAEPLSGPPKGAALLLGSGDGPSGPSGNGGLGRRASTELAFFTVSLMALGAMIARRSRRPLMVRSAL